jgi:Peptidase_C39 like family
LAVVAAGLLALGLATPGAAAASSAPASTAVEVQTVRTASGEYQVSVGGTVRATVPVSDPAYEVRATLSPDGRTAAVITDFDGTAGASLRLLDVDAGALRTVAKGRIGSAAFAPDGRLGYIDGQRVLADGKRVAKVPGQQAQVLGWTADGAGMFVQHRDDTTGSPSLSRLDVATGAWSAVLASDPAAGVVYRDFRVARVAGQPGISAIRASHIYPCAGKGSALVLADERGTVLQELGRTSGAYRSATWSADGRTVTFELQGCVRDKSQGPAQLDAVNGVYVLDRGTGAAQRVVSGLPTAFQLADSPSGATVRFASARFGTREVDATGTQGTDATSIDAAAHSVTVQSKIVPSTFIHQLWDTADDFNGNSACGPTSAVMDLAGYQLGSTFSVWASWPYGHNSPYGGYISKVYSAYGTTYNAYAPDPNWNYFAGAYGWLVDTPDQGTIHAYLTDYLDRHVSYAIAQGGSGTTASWIRSKIDANLMVVVSGYFAYGQFGHIGLITGYTDDGRFYVNDPYGAGTDGSYDGKNTVYTMDYMRGWAFWAA